MRSQVHDVTAGRSALAFQERPDLPQPIRDPMDPRCGKTAIQLRDRRQATRADDYARRDQPTSSSH